MFARLRQFLLYNNAFPLLVGGLFLTSGAALAADEGVRGAVSDAVVERTTKVVSVDNTHLLSTDFDTYTPELLITDVREDEENYYVAYSLETIDLIDYVWQPTKRSMVLVVSKADLNGRDLGLRVTRELKEIVEGQIALLRETKEIEQREGESKKVVATVYEGLVGRYFDPELQEFPGYDPVIPPEEIPEQPQTETPPESEESALLSLQILGPNPMTLSVGEPYVELGVVVLRDGAIIDDALVTISGTVDTASPGRYTLRYKAVAGEQSIEKNRVIQVQDGSGGSGSQPDTTAPVITVVGESSVELMVGDTYVDAGATASDDVDGDLTASIMRSGDVDTTSAGTYTVTYSVSDAAGNTAEAVRTVTVLQAPDEELPAEETPIAEEVTPEAPQESAPVEAAPSETVNQ